MKVLGPALLEPKVLKANDRSNPEKTRIHKKHLSCDEFLITQVQRYLVGVYSVQINSLLSQYGHNYIQVLPSIFVDQI